MAANNRKAPQRWPPKNADDRNRHAAPRAPPAGGSLHAKRRIDNKKVQETLNDMFANIFDSEIIRSVAHSCDWKLNKAIEALIMLAEGEFNEFPDTKFAENYGSSSSFQQSRLLSHNRSNEKSSVSSKPRCTKDSCLTEKPSLSESPHSRSTKSTKSKCIMMNASQGTIKVTYKGQNDAELSDDDADVVIEEENVFEIGELELSYADATQSMYQFLSPFDQFHIDSTQHSLGTSSGGTVPSPTCKLPVKSINVPSDLSHGVDKLPAKVETKKTKHWPKFERIKRQINAGIKVMVLMRGCPGSGKTSLARHIIKSTYGENEQKYVFSTDHYFVFVGNGKYEFDPRMLPTAHQWNQQRVGEEVRKGTNPIIIDNTNLEAWEMEPYVKMAVQCGYNVELLEPRTSWRYNSFELERKNTHGVARRRIEDMLLRFERDLTSDKLFFLYNVKYSPNNAPPQYTSQQKPVVMTEDGSSSGAKRKMKMKTNCEGKSSKNIIEPLSFQNKNIVAKPIQLSGTLGSDIADREIQESLDVLLSEWNRTIMSAENEEAQNDITQTKDFSQVGDVTADDRISDESGMRDDYVCDSSKNSARAGEDLPALETLNAEVVGGDEMDFMIESEENSDEEFEFACGNDEWEVESGDDAKSQLNSALISDVCKETVNMSSLKDETIENVPCMEYVLVLSDGTLLPQKSYHKELNSSSLSKKSGRAWEYLLMTDDNNSKLLFHPTNNNVLQHTDSREIEETILEDSKSNLLISKSTNILDQTVKDALPGSAFLQKIAAEDPPLESLLFSEIDMENICCTEPLNTQHEDVDLIANTENSYKGLDQLLAEGAALLNIAFAGVNDSASSESLSISQKSLLESEEIENVIPTENKSPASKSVQDSSVIPILAPIGEPLFNSELQMQDKQVHFDYELRNSVDSDSKDCEIQEVTSKECSVNSANSLLSQEEDAQQDYDNSASDVESTQITSSELVSILSEERESTSHEMELKASEASTCSSDSNLNKDSAREILEEWAEGTSWDEKETTTAGVKPLPESSSPKPARKNNKRQTPLESSPEKCSEERTLVESFATASEYNWSAVEEPLATWDDENKSLDKSHKKLVEKVVPQPQRKMFAAMPGEGSGGFENKFAVEELMSTSNVEADISSLKPISESDDLLKFASEKELGNITTDAGQKDLTEQVSNLPLELDNFASASSCYSERATFVWPENVMHSSTNTHHADFILLSNVNTGSQVEDSGIKVLPALGRNIIESDTKLGLAQEVRKVGPILMLDKSSMTYDIVYSTPERDNIKEQLEELINMFPHCQIEDLQEIFEKCNRDINWTVDLLLESATQGIEISTPKITCGTEPEVGVLVDINTSVMNREMKDQPSNSNFGRINTSPTIESFSLPSTSVHKTLVNQESSVKPLPNKRNGKKDRTPVSEMSLLLKKQLEENIVINDEHYSEHVSRIRKIRHGEIDVADESGISQDRVEGLNEQALPQSLMDASPDDLLLQQTSDGDIASGYTLRPEAPQWELYEIESKENSYEEEEMVPLKMDTAFAQQLHNLFGTAYLPFNPDITPTINLPMSLARQLHYYMMEAEQCSYDLMMQEDEELARKLQEQEDRVSAETIVSSANTQVPDLREIMDMEMALALYKTDQKQNAESKEALATKLTKDLLCDWFPTLPKDILVNVFEAHNHSFEDTLEVLLASTEEDHTVRTVMTPEARAAQERALLQKASLESEKRKDDMQSGKVDNAEVTQEQAMEDAKHYRSEAGRHQCLRQECQLKATSAYNRGLKAAAVYYSQMAALHKERVDENNAKAASSFLLAHSLGNLCTTLDLHFFKVVEALQVLDMFLDHHITRLLESNIRAIPVFVITGRGLRSTGGRSRIKPAVIQRLEQRGLRHEEENPGLLKVLITRAASSSNRIGT